MSSLQKTFKALRAIENNIAQHMDLFVANDLELDAEYKRGLSEEYI